MNRELTDTDSDARNWGESEAVVEVKFSDGSCIRRVALSGIIVLLEGSAIGYETPLIQETGLLWKMENYLSEKLVERQCTVVANVGLQGDRVTTISEKISVLVSKTELCSLFQCCISV